MIGLNNMKSLFWKTCSITLIIVFSLIVASAISYTAYSFGVDYRIREDRITDVIFADIDECDGFQKLDYTNITIKKVKDASVDECVDGLQYVDFYIADFCSEELRFTIHAYEFEDELSAKDYFSAYFGFSPFETNPCVYDFGLIKSDYCVISGNRIYVINYLCIYEYEVKAALYRTFTEEI